MQRTAGTDKEGLLRDRIYREVRQAIISGELRAATLIKEAEMARQYQVSKSPVREALLILAFEGWLEPLPGAGYLVTQVTVREVQNVFHLRLLLEVEAAGLAATRLSAQDIAALESIVKDGSVLQSGVAPAVGGGPVVAVPNSIPDPNHQFHLLIARAAGNERLTQLLETFLCEMDRVALLDLDLARENMDAEHKAIVAALKARDPEAAREAMRKHIESARARTLQHLA